MENQQGLLVGGDPSDPRRGLTVNVQQHTLEHAEENALSPSLRKAMQHALRAAVILAAFLMGLWMVLPSGIAFIRFGARAWARLNGADGGFKQLEGAMAAPTLALVNRWLATSRGWQPTDEPASGHLVEVSNGAITLALEKKRAVVSVLGFRFATPATPDHARLSEMLLGHLDCLAEWEPPGRGPDELEACGLEYPAEMRRRLLALPPSLRDLAGEHWVVAEFEEPPKDLPAEVAKVEEESSRPIPDGPTDPRDERARWSNRLFLGFTREAETSLGDGTRGMTWLDLAYSSPPRPCWFPLERLTEKDGDWSGRFDGTVTYAGGAPREEHLSLTLHPVDAAFLYVDWEDRSEQPRVGCPRHLRALVALDSPQRFCWDPSSFQDRAFQDRVDEKCHALADTMRR